MATMSVSLINLAKDYLPSEVVHQISDLIGESPENTERAIEAGIPSLLAGLLNWASTPSGASRVVETLKQEPAELKEIGGLDEVLGNLGGILGGSSRDDLIKLGQSILKMIFGGKLGSVVDLVAKCSGIKTGGAASLLGMLAPFLLSLLRKQTISQGLSIPSILEMLKGQRDEIARLAPEGLAGALGLKSLTDLGTAAESLKLATAEPHREPERRVTTPTEHRVATPASEGSSLRWALPLAALAVCFLAAWYFMSPENRAPKAPSQPPAVAQAPMRNLPEPSPRTNEPTPPPRIHEPTPRTEAEAGRTVAEPGKAEAGRAVAEADRKAAGSDRMTSEKGREADKPLAEAGKMIRELEKTAAKTAQKIAEAGRTAIETAFKKVVLTLPGDIKLEVPENSYLHTLAQHLLDPTRTKLPEHLVANTLSFEDDTNRLSPESGSAIASLATIMKAFPNAKLRIEGHTDNVGDRAENLRRSQERALAVKDALVNDGAPADRIIAEGVGPDRPIASNDTEEGRIVNRRIELSVSTN
jgi:outer membrane protein OmpA-like peptidoglycan-associated protein